MIRSAVAVIAGLVVTVILVAVMTAAATSITGIEMGDTATTGYLVLNLVGSAIAGMVGGAVAGYIAEHTPHGHVIGLAVVILLLSFPVALSAPAPGQPTWYPLTLSVLGPASVLLGGLVAHRLGWLDRQAETPTGSRADRR